MAFLLAQAFLENSNRRYILPSMQCKKNIVACFTLQMISTVLRNYTA